jgi:hypothetical protein
MGWQNKPNTFCKSVARMAAGCRVRGAAGGLENQAGFVKALAAPPAFLDPFLAFC